MSDRVTRRGFLSRSSRAAVAAASSVAILPEGRLAAATDGKIRIGQIGTGHGHAAGKMAVYRESDDFEVVGIVEEDPELRERAKRSKTYSDLRWMTRQELLNTPGLQAVAVETRVRDLLDVAEECVDAGMHIHLDKPAGSSLPQFKRILDAADGKRLVVQMGYMYRYNPAIVLLRDLLQKGWLGEPFEVQTVMSKVVGRESRRALAEYPGGMMFELGCHIIDLTVSVLGRPGTVIPYRRHSSEIEDALVDNMLAVCLYPRALASIKSSALEVEGFARRHFVVCGSEGTCHVQPLDAPDVWLALSRDRGKYRKGIQEVKFGRYRRYVGDAVDFARIIRGEKASDYPSSHDYTVQATVHRASGIRLDR